MSTEEEVHITSYANESAGFTGILRHRCANCTSHRRLGIH
jgi:hypothetical protein